MDRCESLAEVMRGTIYGRNNNVAHGTDVALPLSDVDSSTPFTELESHVESWFVSELTRGTDMPPEPSPSDPSQTLPEWPSHPPLANELVGNDRRSVWRDVSPPLRNLHSSQSFRE